ncbi:unnamed protein product [Rotaria sp. Silwood1]|nr:unnamed protein product [Rotaria sp. Silwood1]CAF5095797.1 unnamed protein product [Rotaria sp. Silwood1]
MVVMKSLTYPPKIFIFTETKSKLFPFSGATTPAGTTKYMSSPLASIPSAMSTTPSTASTPSRTPPTSTAQTSTASEAMTTTLICPLTEGMTYY